MEQLDINGEAPQASIQKAAMEYGLIISLISILLTLIPVITHMDMTNTLYRIVNFVISITIVIWMIKHFRDKRNSGRLTLGQGVKLSALTGLFVGIIMAFFVVILYKFISPELLDQIMEKAYDDMSKNDMSSEQVDQAMSMISWMFTPTFFAISTLLGSIISYTVIGLIGSAILKKDA